MGYTHWLRLIIINQSGADIVVRNASLSNFGSKFHQNSDKDTGVTPEQINKTIIKAFNKKQPADKHSQVISSCGTKNAMLPLWASIELYTSDVREPPHSDFKVCKIEWYDAYWSWNNNSFEVTDVNESKFFIPAVKYNKDGGALGEITITVNSAS